MEDCILCKIISGEVSSHKVYENDNTLAIMDIHPIKEGHVLVFPKAHVKTFEQMDEADFGRLMQAVHKVSRKMKEILTPSKVGVVIEGFDVPHVHVKVIPIENEVELRHIPNMKAEPDHEALAEMASILEIK